ncbi:MAG: hypothetical protein LBU53_02300 [Zoogloeaceae bacterium]|jgi:hypothetical protein|nr:hypothetical protein [Zoogloeaceae bacterium]
MLLTILTGVLSLLCLPDALAKAPKGHKILETFHAGEFQYQIAVEPSVVIKDPSEENEARTEYPMTIHLLKNGKRVDKAILSQASLLPDFRAEHFVPDYSKRKLRSWSSGHEISRGVTWAQTVRLDAVNTGLLVTQSRGWEHVTDNHELYVIYKGKLKKVWSFSGDPGSPWISSWVYPVFDQKQHVLLFLRYQSPNYTAKDHDTYEVDMLRWQADRGTIETIPLPVKDFPLYVVVIDFYPDMVQARETAPKPYCTNYWNYVLASRDYPQLGKLKNSKDFFSGNIFFTVDEAQKYQEALKQCEPATDSRIFILNEGE